jgi:hypothetical protein
MEILRLPFAGTHPGLLDRLGRRVREEWVAWALEQPDVAEHPSWTVPWDDLTERDKDVDRRIGLALYALGRAEER